MKKTQSDIFTVLRSDETLLRLLYYKPVDGMDNPLDPTKQNILDMSNPWPIINERIIFTPTFYGLQENEICRISFYHGKRSFNRNNRIISKQRFNVDVFTHYSYNDVDQRLAWICDTVDELLCNKNITGLGKAIPVDGYEINAPDNYAGYRLIYEYGDFVG